MPTENDVFHINVNICDRPYRLKVKPEEEEAVRKAAHQISDRVKTLQAQFAGKDKQDYLAMHALTLAVSVFNYEQKENEGSNILIQELSGIEQKIAKALEQSE